MFSWGSHVLRIKDLFTEVGVQRSGTFIAGVHGTCKLQYRETLWKANVTATGEEGITKEDEGKREVSFSLKTRNGQKGDVEDCEHFWITRPPVGLEDSAVFGRPGGGRGWVRCYKKEGGKNRVGTSLTTFGLLGPRCAP